MKTTLRKVTLSTLLLFLFGLNAWAQPFVTVLQPAEAGIVWDLGSTRLISWNTNFTQPVKIDLVDYTDINTPVVTPIVASTINSTYAWEIDPMVFSAGAFYKVRVTSTINPAFNAESANYFTLAVSLPGAFIAVEQPSALGINIIKGSTYLISWNHNITGQSKIELINDFDNSTTLIAAAVDNSTYEWTVSPLLPSGVQYKVKVSSVNDPLIFDESDNYFSITDFGTGTVKVLQPDAAGIKWVRGSQYLISWIDDLPDPVEIDLVRATPFWIANDNTNNSAWNTGSNTGCGFGPWTITKVSAFGGFAQANKGNPASAGIIGLTNPTYRVVAYSDPQDDGNYVNADRVFNALEVGYTLSFNWGFNWSSGDAAAGSKGIRLYTGGTGGTELVHIYNENDQFEIKINGATMFSNHGLNAMALNFEYTSVGSLRIYSTGRDGVESFDQTIAVSGAPDAIRFYSIGQFTDGTWADNRALYFDNFLIRTSRLNLATNVIGSTWVWTVPTCLQTGNNFQIEVLDASRTISDASDNGFQISSTHGGTYITVLQPSDAGITWLRGKKHLISWIDDIVEPVSIRLLNAANVEIATLANNVVGSTWVWDIPALTYPVGNYKIRVQAAGLSDVSDHAFALADVPPGGGITMQQPNIANLKWLRGGSYLISWYPDGVFGPFTIELWKGGVFHANLATGVNGSTWTWDIPTTPAFPLATDYRIRVTANSGLVTGLSANNFELIDTPGGTVEVLQPNGGEIFYKGVAYWIAWIDDIPEPMHIDLLEYNNLNILQSTTSIATSVIGSAHVWTVPALQPTGSHFKVRVYSSINPAFGDESDGYFSIMDLPLTFSTFPNPATDHFTIRFDEMANENFTILLTDRFNMPIYTKVVDAKSMKDLTVSTLGMKNGVYFLTITSASSKTTQKVLIQR